jgi:hypothetical protein
MPNDSDVRADLFGSIKTLATVVYATDWTNLDEVKATSATVHKFCARAELIRKMHDEAVWEGWSSGKFTSAEVASVRQQRGTGSKTNPLAAFED